MKQSFGDDVSKMLFETSRTTRTSLGVVGSPDTEDFRVTRYGTLPGVSSIFGMCVDGIGTKTNIAEYLGYWGTIGWDLVAMVADDAVAMGATPFMLSVTYDIGPYNEAKETTVFKHLEKLGASVARAANAVPVPIVTGEFAQMGNKVHGVYDDLKCIANAALTWTANRGDIVSGKNVAPGDTIIGLSESGVRSNGFTLLQNVLTKRYGQQWLDVKIQGATLGHLALKPSFLYAPIIQKLTEKIRNTQNTYISGMIHVTGGGLTGRLRSYLERSGHAARITEVLEPCALLKHIVEENLVSLETAYSTWNMGQGFLLITPHSKEVLAVLDTIISQSRLPLIAKPIGVVVEKTTETSVTIERKVSIKF